MAGAIFTRGRSTAGGRLLLNDIQAGLGFRDAPMPIAIKAAVHRPRICDIPNGPRKSKLRFRLIRPERLGGIPRLHASLRVRLGVNHRRLALVRSLGSALNCHHRQRYDQAERRKTCDSLYQFQRHIIFSFCGRAALKSRDECHKADETTVANFSRVRFRHISRSRFFVSIVSGGSPLEAMSATPLGSAGDIRSDCRRCAPPLGRPIFSQRRCARSISTALELFRFDLLGGPGIPACWMKQAGRAPTRNQGGQHEDRSGSPIRRRRCDARRGPAGAGARPR